MKIIGIVGALDFPSSEGRVWGRLREAFSQYFPDAPMVVEHELFLPWHSDQIKEYAKRIVTTHDTGEELVLVGYSMGGVIACIIAPQFKKSSVRLIASINAPHKPQYFYRKLGTTRQRVISPLITYAGIFALVVPWFLTHHPSAGQHVSIFTDHWFMFRQTKYPARIIAKTMATLLQQPLL